VCAARVRSQNHGTGLETREISPIHKSYAIKISEPIGAEGSDVIGIIVSAPKPPNYLTFAILYIILYC
jgi:hypothetical protein